MRGAYLKSSDNCREGGCRGGIGSRYDDYELEIGNGKNASVEMVALCVHIDEIMSLLELLKTKEPLVYMVLDSMNREKTRLHNEMMTG